MAGGRTGGGGAVAEVPGVAGDGAVAVAAGAAVEVARQIGAAEGERRRRFGIGVATAVTAQEGHRVGGLDQAVSVAVVAPGVTEIFGRRGQRVADIGRACARVAAPHQRGHAGHVRGGHGCPVEELVAVGRRRLLGGDRGVAAQLVGDQETAVFAAHADGGNRRAGAERWAVAVERAEEAARCIVVDDRRGAAAGFDIRDLVAERDVAAFAQHGIAVPAARAVAQPTVDQVAAGGGAGGPIERRYGVIGAVYPGVGADRRHRAQHAHAGSGQFDLAVFLREVCDHLVFVDRGHRDHGRVAGRVAERGRAVVAGRGDRKHALVEQVLEALLGSAGGAASAQAHVDHVGAGVAAGKGRLDDAGGVAVAARPGSPAVVAEDLGDGQRDVAAGHDADHPVAVVQGRDGAGHVGAVAAGVDERIAAAAEFQADDVGVLQVEVADVVTRVDDADVERAGVGVADQVGLGHGDAERHRLGHRVDARILLDTDDVRISFQGIERGFRDRDRHGVDGFIGQIDLDPAAGRLDRGGAVARLSRGELDDVAVVVGPRRHGAGHGRGADQARELLRESMHGRVLSCLCFPAEAPGCERARRPGAPRGLSDHAARFSDAACCAAKDRSPLTPRFCSHGHDLWHSLSFSLNTVKWRCQVAERAQRGFFAAVEGTGHVSAPADPRSSADRDHNDADQSATETWRSMSAMTW